MREGWEYKKLGDVCQVSAGQGAPQGEDNYSDVGIPFVKAGNLVELINGKQESDIPKVSDEVAKAHRLVLYKTGSVVFAKSGMSCMKGHVYTLKNDCYVVSHLAILQPQNISSAYLNYYLQYHKPQNLIKDEGYPSISLKDIKNSIISLPSNIEQENRVVSELDKINELIRLKKEQLRDYDNLAQSIFYEMFGDPVENEKGWEVKKLIETVVLECTISYGIVQPGDGVEDGIPVVRPIDLTGTFVSTNNLKKTTEKISSSYSRTILTGKELLVCVRGTTGVCSLVTDELKGCNVTRGITPLLFNNNTDRWFMYYQFQMPQIKCIIADYTKGITLKQINMADFRKIPVILPPLPLQQLFAKRIELIEQQKAEIQTTIADLETLLASRMQYWFD